MKRIQRILAKLFDYVTWGGFLFFLHYEILDNSLFSSVLLLVFLPLLFIPVETLSLWLFNTTLGKFLFGIRYVQKLSLYRAFFLSLKKNLLLFPLFIPILQIPFTYIYVKELFHPLNRFDSMDRLDLIYPNKAGWKKGLSFFMGSCILLLTFFPSQSIYHVKTRIFAEKPFSFDLSDWQKIESKELSCKVCFPKKPLYKETHYTIKSSNTPLTYKEYFLSDQIDYCLGYMQLPKNWMRWGSSIVLNTGFKFLSKEQKILSKSRTYFHGLPAIQYTLQRGNKAIKGNIFLVQNQLCCIQVCSAHISHDVEMQAQKFFNSFSQNS